jgi:hypothetical protein
LRPTLDQHIACPKRAPAWVECRSRDDLSSGRRRQFGVEIGGKDGFQFFEQPASRSRGAAPSARWRAHSAALRGNFAVIAFA